VVLPRIEPIDAKLREGSTRLAEVLP